MVVESPATVEKPSEPPVGETEDFKEAEKKIFLKEKEKKADPGKALLEEKHKQNKRENSSANEYPDDPTNLIVNYLPVYFTQQHLRELFEGYGEIESLIVMCTKHDSYKRKSKGYGFVKFRTREAAAAAIAGVDGTKIANKTIKVSIARPGRARRCSNVFVSRLPLEWNSSDLQEAFSKFGHVVECRVLKFSDGKSRRCGFVRYDSDAEAKLALKEMTGHRPTQHDSPLQVNLSVNHNPDSQKPASYRHNNSTYPSHRGWSLAEHINDTMHNRDDDDRMHVPAQSSVNTDVMFERAPPPERRPWERPARSSRRSRRRKPRYNQHDDRHDMHEDDYERERPREHYDDYSDRMHSNSDVFDPAIYKGYRTPCDRLEDDHRNYEGYSSPYVHREPEYSPAPRYRDENRRRYYDPEPQSYKSRESSTDEKGCRLFVQNLPTFYEETHLDQLFSPYGEVVSTQVQRDRKGRSIGTAFVTFGHSVEAHAAVDALDEVMLSTQTLEIRQM